MKKATRTTKVEPTLTAAPCPVDAALERADVDLQAAVARLLPAIVAVPWATIGQELLKTVFFAGRSAGVTELVGERDKIVSPK